MNRRECIQGIGAAMLLAQSAQGELPTMEDDTVYELRIYHLHEGKLPLILERFRTKETAIFERFGMHGVGYWTPTDDPLAGRTLTYMLRHKSRAAATESWAKFKVDPEWVALKATSEKDGEFVEKIDSTFMKPTDFFPKR